MALLYILLTISALIFLYFKVRCTYGAAGFVLK